MIVGAGPAGLAVGALLRRAGVACLLIEGGERVGWSWRRHDPWLVLHTTRAASGLPLHPFGAGSRYPSRDDVVSYLAAYSERFALDVRPGTHVHSATREPGGWLLDTSGGPLRTTCLVLATGAFRRPRRLQLEGAERFDGPILHSSEVQDTASFADSVVLIIGAGNTGCDLALELLRRGARPVLSVRGPIFALPREVLGFNWRTLLGIVPEATTAVAKRLGGASRRTAHAAAAALWCSVSRRRFAGAQSAGLPLARPADLIEHWQTGRPPVTSEAALDAVARGEIGVIAEASSLAGNRVRLADGEEIGADAIVLATGFDAGLEELLPGHRDSVGNAAAGLFLCGYRPELRAIGREAHDVARRIVAQRHLLA